ncbi:MAG: hypothetical protein BWX73_00789 [Lentisphaerae bacterium ADurb.Bin082]|jgi:hypothetical protein|nr:MAG: hypothetical protein BWX73_00789 [Lentisphaerae bacterium ADurb.Bin082]
MVRPKPGKPSTSKSARWLKIIGFVVGGLVLLVILIAFGVYFYASHLRTSLTATAPLEIAPVEITPVQKRQVEKVYTQVRQAMEQGRATEAVLPGEDINALLSLTPETREVSQRASIALDGDTAKATVSLPLDGVEGMQGRYLNGDFTFRLAVQDGKMQIKILSAVANQRPVPQYIINKLNERDLGEEVARRLGRNQVSRLDSLIIEDGQLKVRTKATR